MHSYQGNLDYKDWSYFKLPQAAFTETIFK